jgi:hypothetical protein
MQRMMTKRMLTGEAERGERLRLGRIFISIAHPGPFPEFTVDPDG